MSKLNLKNLKLEAGRSTLRYSPAGRGYLFWMAVFPAAVWLIYSWMDVGPGIEEGLFGFLEATEPMDSSWLRFSAGVLWAVLFLSAGLLLRGLLEVDYEKQRIRNQLRLGILPIWTRSAPLAEAAVITVSRERFALFFGNGSHWIFGDSLLHEPHGRVGKWGQSLAEQIQVEFLPGSQEDRGSVARSRTDSPSGPRDIEFVRPERSIFQGIATLLSNTVLLIPLVFLLFAGLLVYKLVYEGIYLSLLYGGKMHHSVRINDKWEESRNGDRYVHVDTSNGELRFYITNYREKTADTPGLQSGRCYDLRYMATGRSGDSHSLAEWKEVDCHE